MRSTILSMDRQTADLIKSEAVGKLADLINRLAGPLADEIGMTLGDTARVFRVRNWVRTLRKTERILKQAGLSPKAVPPRLFLPITEACSIEDSETLQDMWAGLLATASQVDSVSPAFIETLKQLSPDEARSLHEIYESIKDRGVAPTAEGIQFVPMLYSEDGARYMVIPDTLERLGLIRRDFDVKLWRYGQRPLDRMTLDDALRVINDAEPRVEDKFVLTSYAIRLLAACRGPKRKQSE